MSSAKRSSPYTQVRKNNYRINKDLSSSHLSVRKQNKNMENEGSKYGHPRQWRKFYRRTEESSPSTDRTPWNENQEHDDGFDDGISASKSSILPPQRCALVLSRCYELNKSGSKKIIIGLNPEEDFKATVFIAKNGNRGIYFPGSTWQILHDQRDSIDSYFQSKLPATVCSLQLTEEVKINFIKLYGENIIQLVKLDRYSVFLGYDSWNGLVNLTKCVQNAIAESDLWSEHVNTEMNNIFTQIKLYIASMCKSCVYPYASETHECSNSEFVEKCMCEYLTCDNDTVNEVGYILPRKRLLYELYFYNPDLILEKISN